MGRRIIVLVLDLDIRVPSEEGELLRHLTLDLTSVGNLSRTRWLAPARAEWILGPFGQSRSGVFAPM